LQVTLIPDWMMSIVRSADPDQPHDDFAGDASFTVVDDVTVTWARTGACG